MAKDMTFASAQERNDYLENVAISYKMNVILGLVAYDPDRDRCANDILAHLERIAHRAATKTTPPSTPVSDPEVLSLEKVDPTPNRGPAS